MFSHYWASCSELCTVHTCVRAADPSTIRVSSFISPSGKKSSFVLVVLILSVTPFRRQRNSEGGQNNLNGMTQTFPPIAKFELHKKTDLHSTLTFSCTLSFSDSWCLKVLLSFFFVSFLSLLLNLRSKSKHVWYICLSLVCALVPCIRLSYFTGLPMPRHGYHPRSRCPC